jgi:hypothetical protein
LQTVTDVDVRFSKLFDLFDAKPGQSRRRTQYFQTALIRRDMKKTTVATIRRILALYFCFGFGVVVLGGVSAQQVDSPLVGKNEQHPKGTMVQQRELKTASLAQDSESAHASVSPGIVGAWTYAGTGTVNTYWITTPGGGIVVIDVQRDLVHAAKAIAAVRGVGKPVRAILITQRCSLPRYLLIRFLYEPTPKKARPILRLNHVKASAAPACSKL